MDMESSAAITECCWQSTREESPLSDEHSQVYESCEMPRTPSMTGMELRVLSLQALSLLTLRKHECLEDSAERDEGTLVNCSLKPRRNCKREGGKKATLLSMTNKISACSERQHAERNVGEL